MSNIREPTPAPPNAVTILEPVGVAALVVTSKPNATTGVFGSIVKKSPDWEPKDLYVSAPDPAVMALLRPKESALEELSRPGSV